LTTPAIFAFIFQIFHFHIFIFIDYFLRSITPLLSMPPLPPFRLPTRFHVFFAATPLRRHAIIISAARRAAALPR
jgi:hypothetical protein